MGNNYQLFRFIVWLGFELYPQRSEVSKTLTLATGRQISYSILYFRRWRQSKRRIWGGDWSFSVSNYHRDNFNCNCIFEMER